MTINEKFCQKIESVQCNVTLAITCAVLGTSWEKLCNELGIDLFTDSDAILKLLSVDFCGKVKVDSNSSSKTIRIQIFKSYLLRSRFTGKTTLGRVKGRLVDSLSREKRFSSSINTLYYNQSHKLLRPMRKMVLFRLATSNLKLF